MRARIAPEWTRIQTLLQSEATGRHVPASTRVIFRQLLAEADAMWRFPEELDPPPTNNLAERAIRQPVRWRNGNFGTDSADGSRFVERILTAVATLKAQGRDPLAYLIEAHVAYVTGSTPPSLLPAAQRPT